MASKSPLLRLPRELRDQIFEHLFEDLNFKRVDFNYHPGGTGRMPTPPYRALPPICQVSQQLYFEATPDFLERITLLLCNIETICGVRNWLATFPSKTGFRAIRQIAFRNFHGPEQIRGYDLIAQCPNVRYLNIMFGDEFADPGTIPSLAIKSLSSSVNAYESLDNIILMHNLHKLTNVPKLDRLMIGFHDWEQPTSIDRARQVMAWLHVKYQGKGKTVRIGCRQMMCYFVAE